MLVVVNVRELAVQVKRVLMDRYSFYLAECFLNFLICWPTSGHSIPL